MCSCLWKRLSEASKCLRDDPTTFKTRVKNSLKGQALRLDHLAMTALLGADVRPRLADWYARVQARPAFSVAVTDWLPAPILAIFRSGGEAAWADVQAIMQAPD